MDTRLLRWLLPLVFGYAAAAEHPQAAMRLPEGPFTLVRDGEPIAPKESMTLDGTLYVDPSGKPWFVFAHEWLQTVDGTIEALPLTAALEPNGTPQVLFKASEARWVAGQPQNGPGMCNNRLVRRPAGSKGLGAARVIRERTDLDGDQ